MMHAGKPHATIAPWKEPTCGGGGVFSTVNVEDVVHPVEEDLVQLVGCSVRHGEALGYVVGIAGRGNPCNQE